MMMMMMRSILCRKNAFSPSPSPSSCCIRFFCDSSSPPQPPRRVTAEAPGVQLPNEENSDVRSVKHSESESESDEDDGILVVPHGEIAPDDVRVYKQDGKIYRAIPGGLRGLRAYYREKLRRLRDM